MMLLINTNEHRSPLKPLWNATHLLNLPHTSQKCHTPLNSLRTSDNANTQNFHGIFAQAKNIFWPIFWWFYLLWFHSLVCCFRVLHWHCMIITWQLVTIVVWDPCILFEPEIFVRFACRDQRDGTYLKIASIGKQMMATICILSLEKSAKE